MVNDGTLDEMDRIRHAAELAADTVLDSFKTRRFPAGYGYQSEGVTDNLAIADVEFVFSLKGQPRYTVVVGGASRSAGQTARYIRDCAAKVVRTGRLVRVSMAIRCETVYKLEVGDV